MSFLTALASGDYDKLRGTALVQPRYAGKLYTSFIPQETIFAARVNGAPTPGSAAVTYDTVTTGAYTDIINDMTVLFSRTADPRDAYHVSIVRKAPTSSILYIQQTYYDIHDNDYIFVLDDYRLQFKQPRDVAGTTYIYYDLTPAGLPPVIRGLRSGYAKWTTAGYYQIAFDISGSYAAHAGASISTYSWSIGDGTLVSGSLSGATPTVKFPPGARWIHVTVTDSGGRSTTRHVPIAAHDDSYLPMVYADDFQISGTLEAGWSASCRAFAGVDELLDRTLAIFWTDDNYNGTDGTITGNNVLFVGRMRSEDNGTDIHPQHVVIQNSRIQFDGTLAQLASIVASSWVLQDNNNGTWNSMPSLTIWRAILFLLAYQTTFLSLFDVTFDSIDTTYPMQESGTALGDALYAIRDMASRIDAIPVSAADGRLEIARDAAFLDDSARNALPTIANWTSSDYMGRGTARSPRHTLGSIVANGGTYFAGTVTPFRAIAPGIVPDDAPGQQPFDKQVLATTPYVGLAQLELNNRAANALAKAWSSEEFRVKHPAGYWFLQPSLSAWYTHTTDDDMRGYAYTTSIRWLLTSIAIAGNNQEGIQSVEATYARETSYSLAGIYGQYLPIPQPDQFKPDDLPPIEEIIPIENPIPIIDWNGSLTWFPESLISLNPGDTGSRGRFFGATTDGHVFSVTFPGGVRTFTDLSPSDEIRGAVGDVICLKFDAWKYRRYFLYGSKGIASIQDLVNGSVDDWVMRTTAYDPGIDDCDPLDLTVANSNITKGSLPADVTGYSTYDPLSIGIFSGGSGWTAETQLETGGGGYKHGVTLRTHYACPVELTGGQFEFTGSFAFTGNLSVKIYYLYEDAPDFTFSAGSNVGVTSGTGAFTSANTDTDDGPVTDVIIEFVYNAGGGVPGSPQFTLTDIEYNGSCTFEDCEEAVADEEYIGDFQSLLNKQNAYAWMTKRAVSGFDWVHFYLTTDNFATVRKTPLATWNSLSNYSFSVNSFNWKNIEAIAGNTVSGIDSYVYESEDGGGLFERSSLSIHIYGGQVWKNWATNVANIKNTAGAYDFVLRGLDGSSNSLFQREGQSDVTVATGADKVGATALSLWVHPRDADFIAIVYRDNSFYTSSNAGGNFAARTSVPGGTSHLARGVIGFPKATNFYLTWGYRAIAWTHDRGSTWVNAYSDYETFRSGAWSSEGETIASMCIDLSIAHPIPVAG